MPNPSQEAMNAATALIEFIDGGAVHLDTMSRRDDYAAIIHRHLSPLIERAKKAEAIVAAHELCHNQHGRVDARAFANGCADEQRKYYGCAPDADEVSQLQAERDRLREALKPFAAMYRGEDDIDNENALLLKRGVASDMTCIWQHNINDAHKALQT